MKELLRLAAVVACLAAPAWGQVPEAQGPQTKVPETQVPEPIRAQTLPPCEQACCFGESDAGTECSYYSPYYGYRPYSQCYWWWVDEGICMI